MKQKKFHRDTEESDRHDNKILECISWENENEKQDLVNQEDIRLKKGDMLDKKNELWAAGTKNTS